MLDDLRGNVRRTATVLVACFGIIALALGYWQVVRGADLAQDAANPRVANARASEPRGRILDRNGVVLADTQMTDQGPVRQLRRPVPGAYDRLPQRPLRRYRSRSGLRCRAAR